MDSIISIKDLKKTYKVHYKKNGGFIAGLNALLFRKYKMITAIDDVNLDIEEENIHALIGPNGAGKSTMIKILSGVLYPSQGTVNVMGYVPWKQRETYVKNIGVFLGQKGQLIWELPPIDSFEVNRVIYKIPKDVYKNNIDYLIDHFRMEEIIYKPVRNLSFGERIKCELVCTLLHDPKLVFLDEPFIGLDAEAKSNIRNFIKKINMEKKVTIILTTHDLNEIDNLCNKVAIINHGRIVFNDSIDIIHGFFSNKKIVDVKFFESPDPLLFNGLNFIHTGPYSVRIEIEMKNKDLKNEVLRILNDFPVKDMNIRSMDIETIIKTIYRQKEFKYPLM